MRTGLPQFLSVVLVYVLYVCCVVSPVGIEALHYLRETVLVDPEAQALPSEVELANRLGVCHVPQVREAMLLLVCDGLR